MAFKRAGDRKGSQYLKKIDPITLHVSFEGASDEAEYFKELSASIPKKFIKLLELIPVPKQTTAGAPSKVYDDLVVHLRKNNIKLDGANRAFLVIDKDHHFSDSHQNATRVALKECSQRNITVLCTSPSIEIWFLCHYMDLTTQSDDYLSRALKNKSVNKTKTFLKKEFSDKRNGETFKDLLKKTELALSNEVKLFAKYPSESMPPDGLQSNAGTIIKEMIDSGVPILDILRK